MICLKKPALATATLKHPNPSGEEERSRRGTHSAAGGEKQQSADQTDEPPPKIEKSTGPNGVSYRRAMRSAGPRPSSSSSLSPLPSRERFSCFLRVGPFRVPGRRPAGRAAFMRGRREAHREGGGRRERPLGWLGVSGGFATRPGRLTRLGLGLPRRARSGRIPSRRFHQRLSPVLHSSPVHSLHPNYY